MTKSVVGSAPGRVNLIGEHTDYNGGFALPLAIPQRTTATVTARNDDLVSASSRASGMDPVEFSVNTAPGDVTGWGAYVAGVFWALRQAGHEVPGANLRVDSDVPTGAGLSSSAALECAVLVALDTLAGLELEPSTMALLGQQAENGYVGAPTGALDQMASMHGRDGHVVLFDAARGTAEPVPCDLDAAGLTLLVIDTQAPHRHADSEYGARRQTCEAAAEALGVPSLREVQQEPAETILAKLDDDVARRRVRHVLGENQRVSETVELLRAGRIRDIGALLTASHVSLRDDYEVTVPELDVAVDAALEAGALGARMTGGGFGGSIVALVDTARASLVGDEVHRAFARHGFTAPHVFTAIPSAGASATA
ncbi:galactokinase [Phytoactinopolyspora mesophila]|uniref:Galactokinase n=1 Tax=Phytoactinopolyspora mesophila TaxID=2650750 RepID=A0A7K3M5G1_9ACTN|nr:galactokinase [Phytoactinopolyspora mesophila]NDL58476.1 galactokinase [Phytoactinopolyspora mesophila]